MKLCGEQTNNSAGTHSRPLREKIGTEITVLLIIIKNQKQRTGRGINTTRPHII